MVLFNAYMQIPFNSHGDSGNNRTLKKRKSWSKRIVHQVCELERNPLSLR